MKIVHIVPALSKGGGERVAVDLANHAARLGHQVTVFAVTKTDETLLRHELDPAVRVMYATDRRGRLRRYFDGIFWLAGNHKHILAADIVHCHMTISAVLGSLLYVTLRMAGHTRPAIVETYHAVGMPIPRWHRWLHAQLATLRDGIVLMAEDPFWTHFVATHPRIPAATIPNGIYPLSSKEPAVSGLPRTLAAFGIPPSCRWVVGTVGRLDSARRPWLYPRIFAPIARRFGDNVHFVIGGAGSELARVQAAIAKEGLETQIHLPGLIRDPRDAYAIMDLYITLNIGSVTGVAALEAAAAGVPILAMQFLEGHKLTEADWIWSSSSLDELADEAIKLLEDADSLRTTAERQRAFVRDRHSIDGMAQAYYQLYTRARARRGDHAAFSAG